VILEIFMKRRFFVTMLMGFIIPYCYGIPSRIITLSGALTETVDALGLGSKIVATDVTSIYPAYVKQLPKVSRNRSISTEGLLSFAPDVVLAPEGHISKEIQYQLKASGIRLIIVKQQYSPVGAINFIQAVANAIGVADKGKILAKKTEKRLQMAIAQIKESKQAKKKVLFIYARGTGTMSVAGKGSSIDAIIRLAGAQNAIQEFSDFKPYTTEAMIKADPDLILMFDFGLSSLGGKASVLKMPGMKLTKAGKNERIIDMDGQLLTNFSVRLPDAILALHRELIR
jgi:iron complex transport system substrate-binding protein